AAHVQAVHVGQAEIEDDEIDVFTGAIERGRALRDSFHDVPLAVEGAQQRHRDAVVVLHDQDSSSHVVEAINVRLIRYIGPRHQNSLSSAPDSETGAVEHGAPERSVADPDGDQTMVPVAVTVRRVPLLVGAPTVTVTTVTAVPLTIAVVATIVTVAVDVLPDLM